MEQNILLTAGIVCIITAIIGGGLSAFDYKMPVINSWKRQTLLGVFGLALLISSFNLQPKESKIPDKKPDPVPKKEIVINYNQTGSVTAYAGNCQEGMNFGYWWNHISISIHNKTDEPFYVSPNQFRLYVSTKIDDHAKDVYMADTYFKNCHPHMLPEQWLQKGETLTGTLSFSVPEKLQDGTETNKGTTYRILRYYPANATSIVFSPY